MSMLGLPAPNACARAATRARPRRIEKHLDPRRQRMDRPSFFGDRNRETASCRVILVSVDNGEDVDKMWVGVTRESADAARRHRRGSVFRSRTAWLRRFQGPGTGCP